MSTDEKPVGDPNFQPGVMSPKSKQTFAELRQGGPSPMTKQKLVFDEDSFEQSFLRCYVCRERFNLVDRMPRLLPCHHSYCQDCIVKLFKKETDRYKSLANFTSSSAPYAVSVGCPMCNASFISTEEGLTQLTTDHRIVQLLDFVGHTDKQTINYCSKHTVMPLNFFCEPCVQPVCRDCTVLDHKAPGDHFVLDIQGALKKYTPVLDTGISSMESEIKSIKENRATVETASVTVQKKHDDLCSEIKSAFDRVRAAIDEREIELKEMAETQSGKNKETLEEKLKVLHEKEDGIVENISALQKAKQDGKVQDMFNIYQKVREYKSEPPMAASEIEAATASTTKFSGKEEELLISKIGSFGEISTSSETEKASSSSGSYSSGSSGTTERNHSTGSSYSSGTSLGSSYGSSYGTTGSRFGSSTSGSTLYGNRYGSARSYRY